MTTPDGNVTYGHDSDDNLVSVTYPDTTVREYVYEDTNLPHHLTGIIDENDDRFATWAYDDAGRAVSSEHAGGKEDVDLVYNANGTTTITSANGASRTYTFSTEAGRQKLSGITGDVCSDCAGGNIKSRTYDANGYLDETVDWNDVTTKTERNSRGLTETLTEAYGTLDQRVTTKVWHADFPLPTKITTPRNVTDIIYYPDGNPSSITITGGTKTRAWAITYNLDGQLKTIDGPRTDVTDVTTLTYHVCTTGGKCGQLHTVTNALGHATTYDTYDSSGRLTQMTEPNGRETSFDYDARGNVRAVTETPVIGLANTVTMTYDGVGQLKTMTTQEGVVLTYDYTAAHYIDSVTDNYGNRVVYSYDSMGNVTDEDTYDPLDVLTRSMDYAYGLDQRIDSVTSGSIVTTLAMDLVGNLETQTDGRENPTQHSYDALNRLDQTTDAKNGITSFAYDAHDNLTSVAAPNNATTGYVFDLLDNLTSESSPDRGTTGYTHDAAGNILTATDARSITATYTYDALNRVKTISYPNTAENVAYGYDVVPSNGIGRLTSISDQSGTTSYTYDEYGRVATDARAISGMTYTTSYAYDDDGNIEAITYPSGRVVDYTRNTTGEVTQVASNMSGIIKSVMSDADYEPFGPASSLTYGNGVSFSYSHNTDYSVDEITSTDISGRSYVYDAAGNVEKILNTINSSDHRQFEYDELSRLTYEEIADEYAIRVWESSPMAYWRLGELSGSVAYDASGNGQNGGYGSSVIMGQPGLAPGTDTAMRIDPPSATSFVATGILTGISITGLELWFSTDSVVADRHLISVRDTSAWHVRTLVFHGTNGKVGVWRNGVAVLYSDNIVTNNEPHHVAVWYEPGSNTTFMMIDGVTQQNTYSGNVYAVTNPQVIVGAFGWYGPLLSGMLGEIDEVAMYNTPVTSATFDNRLTPIVAGTGASYDFIYDANGNRTSIDDGTSSTVLGYDTASNRLSSIGGSTVLLDMAGNQTSDLGGSRTFAYSNAGRLVEVWNSGLLTASYGHNALGQRTRKTVGSTSTVYLYDQDGNLLSEYTAAGVHIRDYVWANSVPIAQIEAGETFSYLHFDHLGTPRLATDDTQTVVWSWDSDAFGAALPDEDPDNDSNATVVNLRFPGQYYDVETGFHYNYYRTLDPSTGRYLGSDPIGLNGGLNTYGYVGGNPLTYSDPLGLCPWCSPILSTGARPTPFIVRPNPIAQGLKSALKNPRKNPPAPFPRGSRIDRILDKAGVPRRVYPDELVETIEACPVPRLGPNSSRPDSLKFLNEVMKGISDIAEVLPSSPVPVSPIEPLRGTAVGSPVEEPYGVPDECFTSACI